MFRKRNVCVCVCVCGCKASVKKYIYIIYSRGGSSLKSNFWKAIFEKQFFEKQFPPLGWSWKQVYPLTHSPLTHSLTHSITLSPSISLTHSINHLKSKFWKASFERQVLKSKFWKASFEKQVLNSKFWTASFEKQVSLLGYKLLTTRGAAFQQKKKEPGVEPLPCTLPPAPPWRRRLRRAREASPLRTGGGRGASGGWLYALSCHVTG